jgi:hypothetical protein
MQKKRRHLSAGEEWAPSCRADPQKSALSALSIRLIVAAGALVGILAGSTLLRPARTGLILLALTAMRMLAAFFAGFTRAPRIVCEVP